jgi:hypothetical protein
MDPLARPGNARQHVIRDPQGEPRIIFGEDDGTRINDHLARYIVESLNSGLNPADPHVNDGWFVKGVEEGDQQDPAILICDPGLEARLEILNSENLEEDKALGRRIATLINTYLLQNEGSPPSTSSFGSPTDKQQTGSRR